MAFLILLTVIATVLDYTKYSEKTTWEWNKGKIITAFDE